MTVFYLKSLQSIPMSSGALALCRLLDVESLEEVPVKSVNLLCTLGDSRPDVLYEPKEMEPNSMIFFYWLRLAFDLGVGEAMLITGEMRAAALNYFNEYNPSNCEGVYQTFMKSDRILVGLLTD